MLCIENMLNKSAPENLRHRSMTRLVERMRLWLKKVKVIFMVAAYKLIANQDTSASCRPETRRWVLPTPPPRSDYQ